VIGKKEVLADNGMGKMTGQQAERISAIKNGSIGRKH